MINAIRGSIIKVEDNSVTVLTTSGIEFSLECSLNTSRHYYAMGGEEKRNARVFSVLSHNENAMSLYGFYDEKERLCFNELQTVSGIGPKAALKILGGITVEELAAALDQQDVKKLSRVPGLGAKTAQKLILQLRNVLVFETGDEKEDEGKQASSSRTSVRFQDLISSFAEMGYDRKNVVRAIDTILGENSAQYAGLDDKEIENRIFTTLLRRLN